MLPESAAPATPYVRIGGESGVRTLVRRFYALMDQLPEAWDVRRMHAEELASSEEKLFLFLSGWLGGPDLYVQRFGPPFLRARHLPFSIGIRERDQWMLCMRTALNEQLEDEALRQLLTDRLAQLADHMRNRAESVAADAAESPSL